MKIVFVLIPPPGLYTYDHILKKIITETTLKGNYLCLVCNIHSVNKALTVYYLLYKLVKLFSYVTTLN